MMRAAITTLSSLRKTFQRTRKKYVLKLRIMFSIHDWLSFVLIKHSEHLLILILRPQLLHPSVAYLEVSQCSPIIH